MPSKGPRKKKEGLITDGCILNENTSGHSTIKTDAKKEKIRQRHHQIQKCPDIAREANPRFAIHNGKDHIHFFRRALCRAILRKRLRVCRHALRNARSRISWRFLQSSQSHENQIVVCAFQPCYHSGRDEWVERTQCREHIISPVEKRQRYVVHIGRERFDRFDIPFCNDLSVINHRNHVAQLFGFLQDMRCEKKSTALPGLFANRLEDIALVDRIHSRRGFIKKHNRCVDHEHLCDLQSSLHAATQIRAFRVYMFRQSELLDCAYRSTLTLVARHRMKACKCQEISFTERNCSTAFLQHRTDVLPNPRRSRSTSNPRTLALPFVGAIQRRENPKQRCFACTIAPSRPKISPRCTRRFTPFRASTGSREPLPVAFEKIVRLIARDRPSS